MYRYLDGITRPVDQPRSWYHTDYLCVPRAAWMLRYDKITNSPMDSGIPDFAFVHALICKHANCKENNLLSSCFGVFGPICISNYVSHSLCALSFRDGTNERNPVAQLSMLTAKVLFERKHRKRRCLRSFETRECTDLVPVNWGNPTNAAIMSSYPSFVVYLV
jgi:hypothetical protein